MLRMKDDMTAAGKRKAPDGSMTDDSLPKRARVTSGEGAAKPKKGVACCAGATHLAPAHINLPAAEHAQA